MFAIAVVGLTAFLICLMTTPLIRNIFLRAKLLDHPDEGRKLHRHAIPRVGGIAIAFSLIGSLAFAYLIAPYGSALRHSALLRFLLPATGVIFVTGLIDDLKTLKPWQKLLGQSLAAGIAVALGARITLHDGPLWLSMSLSFVWLLVCTNAFNLIDGIDGLASGVALFATAATLLSAILTFNGPLAFASAALVGGLAAFLRYNFHPASIFLGDCGSLTIGFLLGCFAISWSQQTGNIFEMGAPLILLTLPLLDVALAIGRRFLRSAPLFQGDRHHIHHKVLARALTTRKAVLILYGASGLTSVFALLLAFSQPRFKLAILFIFCALTLVGVANLRYIEFSAAVRSVRRKSVLRLIKEEIYLDELGLALAKANTIEAIWDVACIACEDLQCATLKMKYHDRVFHIAIDLEDANMAWAITIPLGQSGELSITRSAESRQTRLMVAVLDSLQAALKQKNLPFENAQSERTLFSYQGAA